jgi:hypothetical protein
MTVPAAPKAIAARPAPSTIHTMSFPPLLGSGLVATGVFGLVGVTTFDADRVVGVTWIVADASIVGDGWALVLGVGATVGGGAV